MNDTLQRSPLDLWRRRFGGRCRRSEPRPFAAMGYLTDVAPIDGFVEIENLALVLLFDEPIRGGRCALRLAGYGASRVPWGIYFGGRANYRFAKDLMLQPVPDGVGYRFNSADEELLSLALDLEEQLFRHARSNRPCREQPLLPKLWAAFHPTTAMRISGEGPELAAYSARTGKLPRDLMEQLRREEQGLVCFPLAWVSHVWQDAVAVFAEVERFPKAQVFRLDDPADDLAGYYGAAEFDFDCRRPTVLRRSNTYHPSLCASA